MFRIWSKERGTRWSTMLNQKQSLIFNFHSRVLMLRQWHQIPGKFLSV